MCDNHGVEAIKVFRDYLRMGVKEMLSRFVGWLRGERWDSQEDYRTSSLYDDEATTARDSAQGGENNSLKAVTVRGKSESIEKLQAGFDRLVDELSGINDHLRRQVAQHEELIARVDQLPKLAESFPASVENQKLLTDQLMAQIKANLLKDQQLLSTLEKIPGEAAKQTDALINIDRQLAASADVDVQMTETFNRFNETLGKLNQSTKDHTTGIAQMSRTFAASDRYLKFVVTRQTRQFMWVFYSALGICLAVIIALVGIVIYLSRSH